MRFLCGVAWTGRLQPYCGSLRLQPATAGYEAKKGCDIRAPRRFWVQTGIQAWLLGTSRLGFQVSARAFVVQEGGHTHLTEAWHNALLGDERNHIMGPYTLYYELYLHIYIHRCIRIYVCMRICVSIYLYRCTYSYIYMYVYIYMYKCVCIYIYRCAFGQPVLQALSIYLLPTCRCPFVSVSMSQKVGSWVPDALWRFSFFCFCFGLAGRPHSNFLASTACFFPKELP